MVNISPLPNPIVVTPEPDNVSGMMTTISFGPVTFNGALAGAERKMSATSSPILTTGSDRHHPMLRDAVLLGTMSNTASTTNTSVRVTPTIPTRDRCCVLRCEQSTGRLSMTSPYRRDHVVILSMPRGNSPSHGQKPRLCVTAIVGDTP